MEKKSHLNSFKYVEMDGEFIETPCQAFELVSPMVSVAKAIPGTPEAARDTPRMASLKDARVVVEDGGYTIWGQFPDFPFKSDKFELGFTFKDQKEVRRARVGKQPLHIINDEVNSLEDSDDDCDFDDWIYLTADGGLNNWQTKDFIPISFSQE